MNLVSLTRTEPDLDWKIRVTQESVGSGEIVRAVVGPEVEAVYKQVKTAVADLISLHADEMQYFGWMMRADRESNLSITIAFKQFHGNFPSEVRIKNIPVDYPSPLHDSLNDIEDAIESNWMKLSAFTPVQMSLFEDYRPLKLDEADTETGPEEDQDTARSPLLLATA